MKRNGGPTTIELLAEVEGECEEHRAQLVVLLAKIRRIREDFVGRNTVRSIAVRDSLIKRAVSESPLANVLGDKALT